VTAVTDDGVQDPCTNCAERKIPCIMSARGTGTCVACAAQKKKCSKTRPQARKAKKAAEGTSRDTSESSQGRERSDTVRASTSTMERMAVLEAVEIQGSQLPTRGRKRAPSAEQVSTPSDSGSSAKRQREQSPVRVDPPTDGSPELGPPSTRGETPAGDDDVPMDAATDVEAAELRGESRGARAKAYLRGRLADIDADLKRLEQESFDEYERSYGEKLRADAERKRVEEERVRVSEVMRNIARAVICLQQTVAELEEVVQQL
jgi:hypothetical protein